MINFLDFVHADKDPRICEEYATLFEVEDQRRRENCTDDSTLLKISEVGPITTKFNMDKNCLIPLAILPEELRKHLVLAGGAVTNRLLGGAWRNADFDLFIYGDCDPVQVILQVIKCWLDHSYQPLACTLSMHTQKLILTKNSLTVEIRISGNYQPLKYQIILRHYQSIGQILRGFDLDPCRFAWTYTGLSEEGPIKWSEGQFYTTLTGQFALRHRLMVTAPYYSYSYEYRLWKYSKRGFKLHIPGVEHLSTDTIDTVSQGIKKGYGAIWLLYLTTVDPLLHDEDCDYHDYTPNNGMRNTGQRKYKVQRWYIYNKEELLARNVKDRWWVDPVYLMTNPDHEFRTLVLPLEELVWSVTEELLLQSNSSRIPADWQVSNACWSLAQLIETVDPGKQGSGSFHPRDDITNYRQWLLNTN